VNERVNQSVKQSKRFLQRRRYTLPFFIIIVIYFVLFFFSLPSLLRINFPCLSYSTKYEYELCPPSQKHTLTLQHAYTHIR
jgi:hypothetical protein